MTHNHEPTTSASSWPSYVAFAGFTRLAEGDLPEVAVQVQRAQQAHGLDSILVFDRRTGAVTDLDLRGTESEVAARHAGSETLARHRGRPKLGVVGREVTLLPRHWDWLASQPGGASTTLRRLVETARKADGGAVRRRTDAAYRFLAGLARALFAGDREGLATLLSAWPADIGVEVSGHLDRSP